MRRVSAVVLSWMLSTVPLLATNQHDLPDEYFANGAMGLAIQGGGAAHLKGFSSIRTNPAMLAMSRQYEMTGAYHWPRYGGELFQVGIVDSKTSPVAAGVSLTKKVDDDSQLAFGPKPSSPIKQRVHFGFAQPVGKVSVGLGGQYVEGFTVEQGASAQLKQVKATTLSFGIAALLTQRIRFAFSGQNLTNKNVSHLAPKALQGGLSVLLGGDRLVINVDYIQRHRIEGLEYGRSKYQAFALKADQLPSNDLADSPSKRVIGSVSAQVYNAFHLLAAYGSDISNNQTSLSGGLAIVSGAMRLVYAAARHDLKVESSHQSVSINVSLNM